MQAVLPSLRPPPPSRQTSLTALAPYGRGAVALAAGVIAGHPALVAALEVPVLPRSSAEDARRPLLDSLPFPRRGNAAASLEMGGATLPSAPPPEDVGAYRRRRPPLTRQRRRRSREELCCTRCRRRRRPARGSACEGAGIRQNAGRGSIGRRSDRAANLHPVHHSAACSRLSTNNSSHSCLRLN